MLKSLVVKFYRHYFAAGLFILANPATVLAQDLDKGITAATPRDAIDGDENTLTDVIGNISNLLILLIGAISVIMLIIGGFRYVVSAGDQNAVTGAKNTILYAIIGLVVALLSAAAINFVLGQLKGS